jgi:cytochrome P450
MSDSQLMNEIMTLVVAGHETTASTLNWAWYLLARHPVVEQRLSREDKPLELGALARCTYTKQVIEEVLRLYRPSWLLTRRAIADDEIDGYFVPAGTEIYISSYIIQRSPEYWLLPFDFEPDRFEPAQVKGRHPLASMPFSAGPRNGVGASRNPTEPDDNLTLFAATL